MALVRLNRALIEDRRVAAGLTLQQLADRIGGDRHLFRDSVHDDDVPIGVVARLAEALDVTIDDLVREEPAPPVPASDQAKATAAVADQNGLTRAQLARALGWTLPQAGAALRHVEHRLRGTGLRLRRVGPQAFRIEPDLATLTAGERLRLSEVSIDDAGLPANVAAVLLGIVRGYGTKRWLEDNVAADDNCIEVLRRAGLVVEHDRLVDILPAVGYSLCLEGWESPDEEPKRDPILGLLRRL